VQAVDSFYNTVNDASEIIINTSDSFDTEEATNLQAGTTYFAVTLKTRAPLIRSALRTTRADAHLRNGERHNGRSGQRHAAAAGDAGRDRGAGSSTGKSGTPSARTAGQAFTITVNLTDDYFNG